MRFVVSSVERHRSEFLHRDDLDNVTKRERQGTFREPEIGVVVVGLWNGFEPIGELVGEVGALFKGNGIGEND